MSSIALSTGVLISPIVDYVNSGGAITDGILMEDGTSFVLLETGDYLLQE